MSDVLVGDWRDLSGRGTCYRRGDPDTVGSFVCLAWQMPYDDLVGLLPLHWAWAVERVNKTGRTQLRTGRIETVDAAKLAAEAALRVLSGQGKLPSMPAPADAMPLFAKEEANDLDCLLR